MSAFRCCSRNMSNGVGQRNGPRSGSSSNAAGTNRSMSAASCHSLWTHRSRNLQRFWDVEFVLKVPARQVSARFTRLVPKPGPKVGVFLLGDVGLDLVYQSG